MQFRPKRSLEDLVNTFIQDCVNGTEAGCIPQGFGFESSEDYLEQEVAHGLRLWHIIFLSAGAVLSVIILICCCIKFRIPRTKQEIEGDYIRRKILKKFTARLKAIQNQELDEMDLKLALDKIRAEFKSDTESLVQSEALSVATISSSGFGNPNSSTYRRASQIAMDISLEDLRVQSMGCGGRLSYALSNCCGRSRRGKVSQTEPGLVPKDTTVKPDKGDKGTVIAGSSKHGKKKSSPPAEVTILDETKSGKQSGVGTKQVKQAELHGKDTKERKKDGKSEKKVDLEKAANEKGVQKKGKSANNKASENPAAGTSDTGRESKQSKDKSKTDKQKSADELKEKKEKERQEKIKKQQEKIEREQKEKERKQKEKEEKARAKSEKSKKK